MCYCPILGECENFNYTVNLNTLIGDGTSNGDHNREYHFWIEVTNRAHLKTIEEVTIHVDDSPPEVGVVIDGPVGSPERDFQSDDLLQWHWRSFIDHESGISKYHYAIGQECFTKDYLQFFNVLELNNNTRVIEYGETTKTHTEYVSQYPDFYRLSVIAFNNAMEPSTAVCSNGITIDKTAPILKHLHLATARTQTSIACTAYNDLWIVTRDAVAQHFPNIPECNHHCKTPVDISLLFIKVTYNSNGTIITPTLEESQHLCRFLPTYHPDQALFMPTDNIDISWESEEPESQVHDFYLGVSSTKQNTLLPDLIGYKSTIGM